MRLALTLLALSATFGSRLHAATPSPESARGADISWQQEMENSNVVFRDATGKAGDLLDVLKGVGINSIRLRVWVNPQWHWSDSADVCRMAKRAKAKGLRIMIDFHYSDSWADPGKQTKPGAWASHNLEQLKADVAAHTTSVLKLLKDSGISPEWVQVGNETNNGMLWEEGKASTSMSNFAALVQSGSKAAKAVFPQTKVVVHISNGFDNGLFRWMFDGMKSNNVDWDVIGMSLYPDSTTWRATEEKCRTNMQDMVSRYGKKVMVAEVGMDWRAADSTYALVKKLIADVQNLPNGAGLGVFYWEPECPPGWSGYQSGAFDSASRKPTHALDAFKEAAPPSAIHPRATIANPTNSVHDILGREQEPSSQNGPIRILPGSMRREETAH